MPKPPVEPCARRNRQALLVCLLLAAVTLAAFWPVHLNDFLSQYDDQDYVTANAHVRQGLTWEAVTWAFRTGHAANWHPLTWLSHILDVQLFRLNPAGHHFTNLFFHIANTLLLFLLLNGTTGATGRSAVVAALFAVHPLHVESVAWVAERKDVLSTFFGLLAILAYASYVKAESRKQKAKSCGEFRASRFTFRASHWCLLALLLYAFSLMSKPMLVTLPFLLLLLDYWPLQRLSLKTQDARLKSLLPFLREKLPFLALAAVSGIVTLSVQQEAMTYYRQLGFPARAANAVVSCARYLGKTFWPQDLAVFYPHPAHWPAWAVAGAALLIGMISLLALWRPWRRPYLVVGWFWFLGLLVPVLGLVQVGVQAMADRYTYLPLVGVFILIAWGGAECLVACRLRAWAGLVVATVVIILCAALTRHQLLFWRNAETIFTHAIAVTRNNWVAHHNLAVLALHGYQDTQRGSVTEQVANRDSAGPAPAQSSLPPRDYLEEVIHHCRQTLQSKPGFPDAHVTLAKALTEQGRLDAALAHLETAIRLAPENPDARQNLAEVLYREGRVTEAVAGYQAALKLNPDWPEVLNNLAWLLATQPSPDVRNGAEAVRLAERACALTGRTNLWFLHTLAAAQAESGDFAHAVTTAARAHHLAVASGQTNLIAIAEQRLQLYRSGQPYRER